MLMHMKRGFTAANGVVSGDGSAGSPYPISNVKLNDLTPGYGLKQEGTRCVLHAGCFFSW
jgi:hypothetical protein